MKFKIGDTYKDRAGDEYRFIAYVPEAREPTQLIFVEVENGCIRYRYSDGGCNPYTTDDRDILPPKKKTRKLYPALSKLVNLSEYYVSDVLYETCPEDAIRLLTEYPPVIIEVEDE